MSKRVESVPQAGGAQTRYRRVYLQPGHGTLAPSSDPVPHSRPAPREVDLESPDGRAVWELSRPWDHWVLVFDCETVPETTDQPLRIGCALLAGIHPDQRVELARTGRLTREALDDIRDVFFFYDPRRVTPEEVEGMCEFARDRAFCRLLGGPPAQVMTKDAFVREVWYPWVYGDGALCVAHNTPFDISRLAEDWTGGRWKVRGEALADGTWTAGSAQEGFTVRLCSCPEAASGKCLTHPAVRIQHVSQAVNFIRFQHLRRPPARPGGKPWTEAFDGYFLDTMTLGKALRAGKGSLSLEGLCRDLAVSYQKPPHDFAGRVNDELLTYVFSDVLATWQLFRAERDEYRRYHLSRPITQVYSPASITKAMLDEMQVPLFMKTHGPSVQEALGPGMTAFFGARSECSHRLEEVEGAYLDFHAEYPATISLMALQCFLTAERITVERGAEVIRKAWRFLQPDGLMARLLARETWKGLAMLVLIRPNGDRLPERSTFAKSEQAAGNIADAFQDGPACWWYLADAAASVLRTGRVPEILDARELVPTGRVTTRPYALYGDERFTVDLATDDLAVQLVRLRDEARQQAAQLPESDAERRQLEGVARAAKIIVNALYGIMVEVNALPETVKGKPVTRHGMEVAEVWTRTCEKAGPRYAGPIGASITAGGRLLLAMAEQMGLDRGFRHAMCDTDSMFYIRTASMSRETFWRHVDEIGAAFRQLDPFRDGADLFELEDRNYALERGLDGTWQTTDRLEPLYYIGVCPKRGVFYNLDPDGTPVFRAFSMHGVTLGNPGALDEEADAEEEDPDSIERLDRVLTGYRSPADIPEPRGSVAAMAGGVGKRWMYDQWYRLIQTVRAGISSDRNVEITDPALDVPAMRQVTASTPALLKQYGKHIPLRPFSFFTVAASFTRDVYFNRMRPDAGEGGWDTACETVGARLIEKEVALEAWRRVWATIMPAGIDPATLGKDYQDVPRCLRRRGGLPLDVAAAQWDPPFAYPQDFVDFLGHTKARYDALRSVSWPSLMRELEKAHDADMVGQTLYAPYCTTGRELLANLRRADTGERVLIAPPTVREVMRDYFRRGNHKMADPHGIGAMQPRHLLIGDSAYILKESSRLLAEEKGEHGAVPVTREAGEAGLGDRMQRWTLDELCWAVPEVERRLLRWYREGKHAPKAGHRALIVAGLVGLESGERMPEWQETRARLERRGVAAVAERLGMRPCDLRRYLSGKRAPRREKLLRLSAILDELDATADVAAMPERSRAGTGGHFLPVVTADGAVGRALTTRDGARACLGVFGSAS